jgi:predicted metalloendopeptidase
VKSSPSTMILWLQQSGFALPSKDYYKDVKIVQILREKIEGVLTNVYTRGLGEIIAAGALARGVVDLEKKLAAASLGQ